MAQILTSQPFPFSHYDAEAGGVVPCGITSGRYVEGTATEMMRLYWKVKSFSVSGSYTNYAFNDPSFPNSASWSGTITSQATSETGLVCGAGMDQSITVSGQINSAFYNEFGFVGSDFYFNSDPNQAVVKLYGAFEFETDQDDTGGINTAVGGSLSPFLIDGFQVYEAGSAVNFDAVGLITGFSATFTAGVLWPYEA